jgi:hypothetical protein
MIGSSGKRQRIYRISLKGRLDDDWADWFNGMTLRRRTDSAGASVTSLTGPVADQAALHGLLARVRDLGLLLLEVECLDSGCEPDPTDAMSDPRF